MFRFDPGDGDGRRVTAGDTTGDTVGDTVGIGAKPAIQRRSRETRDKLIDALDRLLREQEFTTITVAAVAQRAGVSVASIYQRFGNRNAAVSILIELYIRRVEDWSRSGRGAPNLDEAPTLREALILIGEAAWHQIEELRYVMAPAYLQSRLHPDLVGEHWREAEALAVSGFRRFLDAHRDEIDHPDLDRAAAMVAYLFNMLLLGRLLHPEGPATWDLPTTADTFAREVADLACGYLQAGPDRRGPGTTDPGDA